MNTKTGIVDADKKEQYSLLRRMRWNALGINKREEYYLVTLIVLIVYCVSYLWFIATPGNSEQHFMGWFEWSDQGLYLKSAQALAREDLSPGNHMYPIGYPLLGSLFVQWLPRHPFFIPNLFFATGIVLTFYASCRKLLTSLESLLLTFFLIILSGFTHTDAIPGGLIWFLTLISPWNNIPVFFAAYLTVWLLIFNTADFRKLWIVSIFIALAFLSRPPDVLFLGLIYLAGLLDFKTMKEKFQAIIVLGVTCTVALAVMLAFRWIMFDSFISPYDVAIGNQGFNAYDLPNKLYLVFIDGLPVYGYHEIMLLPQMPWLLLCVPGLFLLAYRTNYKSWFLIASIIACVAFYVSFNAQSPNMIMNYHGYRYFVWVLPWLGLGAYLTLTRSAPEFGWKKTLIGVAIPILAVFFMGWKESPVAVISASSDSNPGRVSQSYDMNTKTFTIKLDLLAPLPADGIRLVFSETPSKNMQVAGNWQNFSLTVDDIKQVLIRDYNLYQDGNMVYVSFRNPVNRTGQLQNVLVQYTDIDNAVLDKANIVKSDFQPFGGAPKIVMPILAEFNPEWGITDEQDYEWGNVINTGLGGNSAPYQLAGWSADEAGYVWSDGSFAVLGFKTQPVSSDLILQLSASGLTSPVRQVARVSINGQYLSEIVLPTIANTKKFRITIPGNFLRDDGILVIRFDFPSASSPSDLGSGSDKRVLSMALRTIVLDLKKK